MTSKFVLFFWILALLTVSSEMPGKSKCEEQRVVIKFLTASGKRPKECYRELEAVFGADAMSVAQVGVWHRRFRGGDMSVKDKVRSGRPASVNTPGNRDKNRTALNQDRRKSVRQLQQDTQVNRGTIHRIIKKDFTMTKVAPKFVPRVLTQEMKQSRMTMCQQNLDLFREDPALLSKVVTGDESYFSLFDMEPKCDSMQWKTSEEPRPTKALRSRSERKAMLTLFFDESGAVLSEFKPPGLRVTAENYVELLKTLKERIRKKRPQLWARSDPQDAASDRTFYLHHDNASPHTATDTLAFIGESGIRMLAHPPYSPDLAPCDFFLFPYLKRKLRGQRFANLDEMQKAVQQMICKTPKQVFQNAILQLPIRWKKCLLASGEYFEGRHWVVTCSWRSSLTQKKGKTKNRQLLHQTLTLVTRTERTDRHLLLVSAFCMDFFQFRNA